MVSARPPHASSSPRVTRYPTSHVGARGARGATLYVRAGCCSRVSVFHVPAIRFIMIPASRKWPGPSERDRPRPQQPMGQSRPLHTIHKFRKFCLIVGAISSSSSHRRCPSNGGPWLSPRRIRTRNGMVGGLESPWHTPTGRPLRWAARLFTKTP